MTTVRTRMHTFNCTCEQIFRILLDQGNKKHLGYIDLCVLVCSVLTDHSRTEIES